MRGPVSNPRPSDSPGSQNRRQTLLLIQPPRLVNDSKEGRPTYTCYGLLASHTDVLEWSRDAEVVWLANCEPASAGLHCLIEIMHQGSERIEQAKWADWMSGERFTMKWTQIKYILWGQGEIIRNIPSKPKGSSTPHRHNLLGYLFSQDGQLVNFDSTYHHATLA